VYAGSSQLLCKEGGTSFSCARLTSVEGVHLKFQEYVHFTRSNTN
jgi:hypothetical protein